MINRERHLQFIAVFAVLTAVFIFGGIRIADLPDEQLQAGLWVRHTHEVLHKLDELSLYLNEAETAERGYLLHGDDRYVAHSNSAADKIILALDEFRQMTIDNQRQQTRIAPLEADIEKKLGVINKNIVQQEMKNQGHVSKLASADISLTEGIGEKIAQMKADEEDLLKQRLQEWQGRAAITQKSFIVGGTMLYVMICMIFAILYSVAQQRKSTLQQERARAENLEKIVETQREIVGNTFELEKAMQIITRRTQELLGAEGCVVEILEDTEMVYKSASGIVEPFTGLRLPANNSFSGLCIEKNIVLLCDDSETDPRVNKEACRKVGVRSMIVVPLHQRGTAIGVLKVASSRVKAFNAMDINTLELLAGVLSSAVNDAMIANNMRLSNVALKEVNVDLEKLAATDGMTGLLNYRSFQKHLVREYDLAKRHGKPLSLLMLDVDYFKQFNDAHGHPAGDAVLKRISVLLQQLTRSTDFVARYGGEEFVILLTETSAEQAWVVANRIQQTVADDDWPLRPITVSLGQSSLDKTVSGADSMIKQADKALYAAKQNGRNRVVKYSEQLL